MSGQPPAILAVSSHVAVGHVGSAAACPALEAMGIACWRADTTHLSNHPGHEQGFTGRIVPADEIEALVAGISRLTGWRGCAGAYAGYMGSAGTPRVLAPALDAARAANPGFLAVVDPVVGDHGRVFVRDGVEAAIHRHLLPRADAITPNAFELSRLADRPVETVADAIAAATVVRARLRSGGPGLVVATGVPDGDGLAVVAVTLGMTAGNEIVLHQKRHDRAFFGTGDLFAGLQLGHWLRTGDPLVAVERAAAGLAVATEITRAGGSVDLALIPNLPAIVQA